MTDAIRPSPEIVAVVRRWHDAVRTKDGDALVNMLCDSPYLRYQGSDEGEEWTGQLFRIGFPDHAREIPDFQWQEHSIEAFEHGNTGWAHTLASLNFPHNGQSVLHRFTNVLVLINGQWQIIQTHVSNGRANMEKIGIEHSALNALVEAARQGFKLDQREGMASVMFTDVAGSSAMAEVLGDRLWTQVIQAHFELANDIVATFGGQFVKSLGDGTMSSFPSARAALSAALELQERNAAMTAEPALPLRIGIHSGDVIQTDDDFFGTVVNKTARLSVLCEPDEVLASDATVLLAGRVDGVVYSDKGLFKLNGLPGEHRVFQVSRQQA